MSRHARYNLPGFPQHVVQRGNNRQRIFLDQKNYHCYADCLQEAAVNQNCEIHAYVFLRNHVHLLVTQKTPTGISQMFQSLGRRYVRYFNERHGRTGTLWEGRYQACVVDSDQYLLLCQRFLELHPVREGLVTDPADHRWSSYSHHALGEPDKLVTTHPAYRTLAKTSEERQRLYRDLIDQGSPKDEAQKIRESICKCGVLGDEPFQKEIERLVGWRVRPGKRGRPRLPEVGGIA